MVPPRYLVAAHLSPDHYKEAQGGYGGTRASEVTTVSFRFLLALPALRPWQASSPRPGSRALTHIDGPASLHCQLPRLGDKHRVRRLSSPLLHLLIADSLIHPRNTVSSQL